MISIEERTKIVKDFIENECIPLLEGKGADYAEDGDSLHNFKIIGELLDLPPEKVMMVYLLKHIISICKWSRSGQDDGSEPIRGRMADAINYLLNGVTFLEEDKKEDKVKTITEIMSGNQFPI